jgi:hypothetical protein
MDMIRAASLCWVALQFSVAALDLTHSSLGFNPKVIFRNLFCHSNVLAKYERLRIEAFEALQRRLRESKSRDLLFCTSILIVIRKLLTNVTVRIRSLMFLSVVHR